VTRGAIADQLANRLLSLSNFADSKYTSESSKIKASELATQGLTFIPDFVSASEASDISRALDDCLDTTREDSVIHYPVFDVVRAPHVMKIATDPHVLETVLRYLGAPGIIVSINAWSSLTQGEEPMGAQIFHRDTDDFRACKMFVYLDDVSTSDGPHIFVRHSHRADQVQQALEGSGRSLSTIPDYFSRNGRHVADSIDSIFGDSVEEITGAAGTCFLENTYSFHRGKTPAGGKRRILQVLYAHIPYHHRLECIEDARPTTFPLNCDDSDLARHAMSFWIQGPTDHSIETMRAMESRNI